MLDEFAFCALALAARSVRPAVEDDEQAASGDRQRPNGLASGDVAYAYGERFGACRIGLGEYSIRVTGASPKIVRGPAGIPVDVLERIFCRGPVRAIPFAVCWGLDAGD